MVYLIGLAAALFLGAGWVAQQRIATRSTSSGLISVKVLVELATSRLWWGGIAAMSIGQTLSAFALQFGPVSAVEPVLVVSLLVALVISAALRRRHPGWLELAGPIVLSVSLVVFLAVSDPQANRDSNPGFNSILASTIVAASVASGLAIAGIATHGRAAQIVESALLASGAGVMYGLQDVATRGVIVVLQHHSLFYLIFTMWPWVTLGAATFGVILSQAAFRAERLDYALPPTVIAQALAGIGLGIALLGDRLTASGTALAFEALCLAGMIAGVALVGLSPALE
jgi:drug/metabolite transporter (DMT)-like permease